MSAISKILRRAPQLLRYPRGAGRFVRDQFLHRHATSLDLRLPWMPYAVIDFLEKYLAPHMIVYEYGSGGSTVWFAKRVSGVVAIEERPLWATSVREALSQDGLEDRAEIRVCETSRESPEAFANSDYAQALPREAADVIVIDGCERLKHMDLRPVAFTIAEERIRPGGIIIVDDSWRYPQLRENHRAYDWHTFIGFRPGDNNISHTDIYFYKMR
jgi:hypothetical protein